MSFLNFLIIREEGVLQFVIGFFVFTYSCSVQKATKESNRDLPQPVAAPEECCSNSATLSRSLIISSSKAASLKLRLMQPCALISCRKNLFTMRPQETLFHDTSTVTDLITRMPS